MAPNPPLDVLQSMINAILIETGKALRPANKDGVKAISNMSTRLKMTIPSTTENFNRALDELESDIVRAKAVLLRDLEEIRSKRIALETPVPILDMATEEKAETAGPSTSNNTNSGANGKGISPEVLVEEEVPARSPEKQPPNEPPIAMAQQMTILHEDSKVPQGPTPPASANETNTDSKPVGLGIDTEGATAEPGSETADIKNSSIDSLFDIPDDDNTGGSGIDLDPMDFSMPDSSTAQNQDFSQTQNTEFDLSNFGNSQDFSMPDLNTATNTQVNTNTQNQTKQDDLFAVANASGANDNMDLDMDLGMAGADDSVFDDMFFGEADDTGIGGGGEMQHGEYDNAFFGLN